MVRERLEALDRPFSLHVGMIRRTLVAGSPRRPDQGLYRSHGHGNSLQTGIESRELYPGWNIPGPIEAFAVMGSDGYLDICTVSGVEYPRPH